MAEDKDRYVSRRSGRVATGMFLLLIGGILMVDQMGVPLPHWIFSWHVLLIAVGLFLGMRNNFRGGTWAILIMVGTFFLVQDYFPEIPLRRFIWPAILIFVGLTIILSPKAHGCWRKQKWQEDWGKWEKRSKEQRQAFFSSKEGYTSEDFVDSTAIFGGVHKKIVSKNFRGGDVTSIMGGTELDLAQADFNGVIRLDITQVMGGTKIIVPAHWEVRSEVTAMFAGFEDKRQHAVTNPDKVLILDGTSFFGGIELRNY